MRREIEEIAVSITLERAEMLRKENSSLNRKLTEMTSRAEKAEKGERQLAGTLERLSRRNEKLEVALASAGILV